MADGAPHSTEAPPKKTLIITHDHCALHMTRKTAPERPARVQYVMGSLKQLKLEDPACAGRMEIQEIQTSSSMLSALSESCCDFARMPRRLPMLSRTASVGYLEEKIVPAVKAVHTQAYLQRLASSCVELLDEAARNPKGARRQQAADQRLRDHWVRLKLRLAAAAPRLQPPCTRGCTRTDPACDPTVLPGAGRRGARCARRRLRPCAARAAPRG